MSKTTPMEEAVNVDAKEQDAPAPAGELREAGVGTLEKLPKAERRGSRLRRRL